MSGIIDGRIPMARCDFDLLQMQSKKIMRIWTFYKMRSSIFDIFVYFIKTRPVIFEVQDIPAMPAPPCFMSLTLFVGFQELLMPPYAACARLGLTERDQVSHVPTPAWMDGSSNEA